MEVQPLQKALVTCVTQNLIRDFYIFTDTPPAYNPTDPIPVHVSTFQSYFYLVSIEFLATTNRKTVDRLVAYLQTAYAHLDILNVDVQFRPEGYSLHLKTRRIR